MARKKVDKVAEAAKLLFNYNRDWGKVLTRRPEQGPPDTVRGSPPPPTDVGATPAPADVGGEPLSPTDVGVGGSVVDLNSLNPNLKIKNYISTSREAPPTSAGDGCLPTVSGGAVPPRALRLLALLLSLRNPEDDTRTWPIGYRAIAKAIGGDYRDLPISRVSAWVVPDVQTLTGTVFRFLCDADEIESMIFRQRAVSGQLVDLPEWVDRRYFNRMTTGQLERLIEIEGSEDGARAVLKMLVANRTVRAPMSLLRCYLGDPKHYQIWPENQRAAVAQAEADARARAQQQAIAKQTEAAKNGPRSTHVVFNRLEER